MPAAGRGVVMETEDSTANNDHNITNGKVDAATNTSPPSRGSTRVDIEGHRFDVPADPVEYHGAARQRTVWPYRAVMENGRTARDMAVVMGAEKIGDGGKRRAGRNVGEETQGVGRGRKMFCRELEARNEGRGDGGGEGEDGVMRDACEGDGSRSSDVGGRAAAKDRPGAYGSGVCKFLPREHRDRLISSFMLKDTIDLEAFNREISPKVSQGETTEALVLY